MVKRVWLCNDVRTQLFQRHLHILQNFVPVIFIISLYFTTTHHHLNLYLYAILFISPISMTDCWQTNRVAWFKGSFTCISNTTHGLLTVFYMYIQCVYLFILYVYTVYIFIYVYTVYIFIYFIYICSIYTVYLSIYLFYMYIQYICSYLFNRYSVDPGGSSTARI
jgi:hypothetical protein